MLLPALLALQTLTVSGETCPAPVDVEARVRVILQLRPEQRLGEGFSVERVEGGLRVVLRSVDDALVGERLLPADGSCDELAQAAAVVLSAWLSDVHPDFASELPDALPKPPLEPSPQAETAPPAKPLSPPPRPFNSPLPSSRRWELGLGLGADLTPGSIVPASLLSVGLEPRRAGLGIRLTALVTWTRQVELGSGQVEWLRWPVGLGPSLGLAANQLRWDVSAGIAAAWLHLRGSSFDNEKTVDDALFGALLSARISGSGRPWTPFATAVAYVWPGESVAYVGGSSSAELRLPGADFLLALGCILGR